MSVLLSFRELPVATSQSIDTLVTNDIPRIGEKITLPYDWQDAQDEIQVYEVVDILHVYQPTETAGAFTHNVYVGVKEFTEN